MIQLHIIVAVDKNFGIGKNGRLPWHMPKDLKHFKAITTKAPKGKMNVVIMGRKTWDSLPEKFKPLPERINFVLTRNKDFLPPSGVEKAGSFNEALALLASKYKAQMGRVFIIGGAEIYKEALKRPELKTVVMTRIVEDFACDTFFPLTEKDFDKQFKRASFTSVNSENDVTFYFATYRKR